MRVLIWLVHGGWSDAFLRGSHEHLVPGIPSDWVAPPTSGTITGVDPDAGPIPTPDVVVTQDLAEREVAERLVGGRLGLDVPWVHVEHNTPKSDVPVSRHPLADRDDVVIAHVTHFTSLFWDTGSTPTRVIEHGVADRGATYTGELPRQAVVVNEPVRRWRVTGTDLLAPLSGAAPVDLFGMKGDGVAHALGVDGSRVAWAGDVPGARLFAEAGRRRVYTHPNRWTSLGLSLLEAMTAGMPVVALDTTDVRRAVPPEAGVVSTDVHELAEGVRAFVADPERAADAGAAAREHALSRFGVGRFLADWDDLLADVVAGRRIR